LLKVVVQKALRQKYVWHRPTSLRAAVPIANCELVAYVKLQKMWGQGVCHLSVYLMFVFVSVICKKLSCTAFEELI